MREFDAKHLDFNEKILHIDDFVADQRLEEHTHQADEAVLREKEGQREGEKEGEKKREREREDK